jgi:RNA polymerase sigma factor (sigma-70 family)
MDDALQRHWQMTQQDQGITDAVTREYGRLRNFVRKRVPDRRDAEDIIQDVFYELVEASRMMQPVEQVTAWLFRVARNRIIDLFRSQRRDASRSQAALVEDGTALEIDDLFPSPDAGPEAAYIRAALLEELEAALDELPEEQREVFVAHEVMGHSFNEISASTGVGVNTLLSRKRYAALALRRRLRSVFDEFVK